MKADSLLIRTIELKDRNGRIVGTKEVVTYQGLLSKAHDEGLKKIATTLVQVPTGDNREVAIVRAEVETEKGLFQGYGDASPGNVNAFIVPHLIRMAETRAKARALRDAVNVGVVSFEELDGDGLDAQDGSGGSGAQKGDQRGNGRPTHASHQNGQQTQAELPMTESQRRYLFRLLAGRGIQNEAAHEFLIGRFGVESLSTVSRFAATKLIDELSGGATGGNGHGPRLQR